MNEYRGDGGDASDDRIPPHAPLDMPRQVLERTERVGLASLLHGTWMPRA